MRQPTAGSAAVRLYDETETANLMVEQPKALGLGNRDYLQMLAHGRGLNQNDARLPEARVALLADHATQQMTLVLKSAIANRGFFPFIYEADYGTAATEAYDRDSRLYEMRPEIVYLSLAVQKYRDRFLVSEPADREGFPEQYLNEVLGIADVLRKAGMRIIISNLALPVERIFGNFSVTTRQSPYRSVLKFNELLADAVSARSNCHVNDVMYIASRVGGQAFIDERLWGNARYLCSPQFLPDVARSVASVVAAAKGRLTKCIVLDLDNTLWGGIVGDDGKDGLKLGGDAYGEAFVTFQRYILSLQQRGYVLAVCSKNDPTVALDAFRNHPEMAMKEEDVSVFVANWNDKASNIEYIARVLNLGLDTFVFVDDSFFERQLVRSKLPAVAVPEMPDDVSDYIQTLERSGLFEATGYTEEDRRRGRMYREEAQRTTAEITYSNIDEYLASLEMRIVCTPFKPSDLSRVAQLMQRSNQFNLRTQRLTAADCEMAMKDANGSITVQARLSDRYGDYGLISAICCNVEDGQLNVRELVMSCRVLKRGVEEYLMNHLFSECRARGLSGIKGEYIATEKNAMVKDFYQRFGFGLSREEGTRQTWYLPAPEYQARRTFIHEATE
jgi:FkbH-like protein